MPGKNFSVARDENALIRVKSSVLFHEVPVNPFVAQHGSTP